MIKKPAFLNWKLNSRQATMSPLEILNQNISNQNLIKHSLVGSQMLEELGFDKEICRAVKVHNSAHCVMPEAPMEKALYVADRKNISIVTARMCKAE